MGFLKIKVLELLCILNILDPPVMELPEHSLSRGQVNLAKAAAAYLLENMNRRVTVPELAKQFSVSEVYMQTIFKGVYGVPVFSYIRIQKMQCAAQQLIATDLPIAEIAGTFGYTNESKFSAAFKAVMGDTPGMWRKEHRKLNII
ncbi:MAG: helix-turn-helix transcriptional regulator [Clostridia bacterium]|nr:helix-turn-helix transcriptional regulator [Clostridia bacterium]